MGGRLRKTGHPFKTMGTREVALRQKIADTDSEWTPHTKHTRHSRSQGRLDAQDPTDAHRPV